MEKSIGCLVAHLGRLIRSEHALFCGSRFASLSLEPELPNYVAELRSCGILSLLDCTRRPACEIIRRTYLFVPISFRRSKHLRVQILVPAAPHQSKLEQSAILIKGFRRPSASFLGIAFIPFAQSGHDPSDALSEIAEDSRMDLVFFDRTGGMPSEKIENF